MSPCARTKPYTLLAPALIKVFDISFKVLPVVYTSSSISIVLPLIFDLSTTLNALSRLVNLCSLVRLVWWGVSLVRIRTSLSICTPYLIKVSHSSSDWLYPLSYWSLYRRSGGKVLRDRLYRILKYRQNF